MTDRERHVFLVELRIQIRIGTVCDDGRPLVTPIWFIFEEDAIRFTQRENSAWFADLRRDSRTCLAIDEQDLRYRRIACRYVPKDAAEDYIQATIDQPRSLYRLPLEAGTVRTCRMAVDDEEPSRHLAPALLPAGRHPQPLTRAEVSNA